MGADQGRDDELCGVSKAKLLRASYEIALTEGNLLVITVTKQNQNIKAGFVGCVPPSGVRAAVDKWPAGATVQSQAQAGHLSTAAAIADLR